MFGLLSFPGAGTVLGAALSSENAKLPTLAQKKAAMAAIVHGGSSSLQHQVALSPTTHAKTSTAQGVGSLPKAQDKSVTTLLASLRNAPLGSQVRAAVVAPTDSPLWNNRPVVPRGIPADEATFIDPTATMIGANHIHFGEKSFVAPFATLNAIWGEIHIGEETNVQDNVSIRAAPNATVELGDKVIIAHNATVFAHAGADIHIGSTGPNAKPAFVGFNSVIDGANIEEDAMVTHLARVAPGITIHSGKKVLPGMFIRTQAEADNVALGKVATVTAADRAFMDGVIEVNVGFAQGYTELYRAHGLAAIQGIGPDADTLFNPGENHPTLNLHGTAHSDVSVPSFRNRIIGDVGLAQGFHQLRQVMGNYDSIRADEGDDAPTAHAHAFDIGMIRSMGDRVTMHALEHTGIAIGNNVRYGFHVLVHGGEDSGNAPATDTTRIGDNVTIGDWAVAFRSTIGNGINIGAHAYVDGSQLYVKDGNVYADTNADGIGDKLMFFGAAVPSRAIIIDNVYLGQVQW
jgi:carbonic anhydrase/acetyltransferase-like protein (isoleucine patch superfamily)